jgi:hypothetical protein
MKEMERVRTCICELRAGLSVLTLKIHFFTGIPICACRSKLDQIRKGAIVMKLTCEQVNTICKGDQERAFSCISVFH